MLISTRETPESGMAQEGCDRVEVINIFKTPMTGPLLCAGARTCASSSGSPSQMRLAFSRFFVACVYSFFRRRITPSSKKSCSRKQTNLSTASIINCSPKALQLANKIKTFAEIGSHLTGSIICADPLSQHLCCLFKLSPNKHLQGADS